MWSYSEADTSGSKSHEFLLRVGTTYGDTVKITPHLLMNYSYQDLRMRNGTQLINTRRSDDKPYTLDGLDSRYKPQWWGVGGGATLSYKQLDLSAETFVGRYYAKQIWNLRNIERDHNAEAAGVRYSISYGVDLSDNLILQYKAVKERFTNTAAGRQGRYKMINNVDHDELTQSLGLAIKF